MGKKFESNIGEADLVLGQDYFGSKVMKVVVEVDDTKEKYKIKRLVTLKNGIILVEDYWRDKSFGEIKSQEYALPKDQWTEEKKDNSDARARARAMLAARRSKKENKPFLSTPEPPMAPAPAPEPPKPTEPEPEPEPEPELEPETEPEKEPEPEPDADQITVEVQRLDGQTVSVKLSPGDTIESVRKQVKDKDGWPIPEYNPVILNGKELEDSSTVEENSVKDGDTLVIGPFQIVIKYEDGKEVTLDVSPDTTISNVKSQIKDVPRNYLKLFYDGTHVDNEKKTIEDYKIPHKGILNVEPIKIGKLWADNVSWMSNKAIVFPKNRAPVQQRDRAEDPDTRGVWKSKTKDAASNDDWKPQKVDIYPPNIKINEDIPKGVWGIDPKETPNDKGEFSPKAIWFFSPGETPDEDECEPCGQWAYREFHKNNPWPPPKKTDQRQVGKLPNIWKQNIPPKATVYPRRKAPKKFDTVKDKDVARGVWKWKKPEAETEKGADRWMPSEVQMYEDGDEPADWDDNKPCGVWGVNPKSESENSKPADIWFVPPKEEPEEGFEPIGKWRVPKKNTWPPKSVGKIDADIQFKKFEKKQGKVGKLNVPAFLQGK